MMMRECYRAVLFIVTGGGGGGRGGLGQQLAQATPLFSFHHDDDDYADADGGDDVADWSDPGWSNIPKQAQ